VPYAFELEALKRSKFVILPHDGYIDFFKRKYSINLEKKAVLLISIGAQSLYMIS